MAPNSRVSSHTPSQRLDEANARIAALERDLAHESERRYRAENNERCFRQLAENIREVFWMTNPTGNELVYISPAYEHIWGQTCDSLHEDPGRRLAWVHDADREHVLKAFKRDATAGRYDETYRIDRPDGEVRWIRDRAYPVHDDEGRLYRLAGFALDITDQVAHHDRISNLHTTIDSRDRIGVFAALGSGLVHELCQPLTAARNFLARARLGLTSGDRGILETLARADSEITRAVSIIHRLREFARRGRPAISTQRLHPVIDDIHQLLDPLLRRHDVFYHGPPLDRVESMELPMDEIFVQQILRNLITNAACAFDDDSKATRDVWVGLDVSSETHIDITVSDNGPGLAADLEIFEPFVSTKAHGVGLGLPVSRMLARSHGGDLFVQSRGRMADSQSKHTEFVLRLPRDTVS